MNTKKYLVKIKGESPLILNVMKREIELEMKALKKDQLAEYEEKNWRKKAPTDTKGNVIIPIRQLRRCFMDACRLSKLVPHNARSKNQTYTKYAESLKYLDTKDTLRIPMKSKKITEYGSYENKNPSASKPAKVWCVRPMMEKWENEFEMVDVFGDMKKEEIKKIWEYAGFICGLGDSRRENFGRFTLVELKEIK